MLHRHFTLVLGIIAFTFCGLTRPAFAQLPPTIVTGAAFTPQQKAIVDNYVDANLKKLLVPTDPSGWTAGRNLIINEVAKQGATTDFLDLYASSINEHLLAPSADYVKNKDARVRLNAAIIVARIAAKAGNGRLAPATLVFLKDSSDGVVLWGLAAAKYVVPALLQVNDVKSADAIGKAAVQATKDHMTPAVIEESYRTMLLDPSLPNAGAPNTIADPAISAFLSNTLALYEYRIKLYDEVDAPVLPASDTWATGFLTSQKVWGAQTKAQEAQTLNDMIALAQGAAKQNAAAASPEMFDVIKRTGQAFTVVAARVNVAGFTNAAKALAAVNPADPPASITAAIDAMDAAVKLTAGPATPPAK